MKLRLRRLCAIFWTWHSGVYTRIYVSKADYPLREKERGREREREREREIKGTGTILDPWAR